MILKKSCQLLALFLCLWAFITGFVQQDPVYVTAILGEDVILPCAFDYPEGVPVPYVIQWQKLGIKIPIYIWYDGYPPHAGEGYEGRVSLADQASLNLTDTRESDSGWYECKIYFLNRPVSPPRNGTFVHLDVHAPPHFKTKPPEVVYVKVGESVSLPCEAEGTPTPAIIWYKDNMPLEEGTNLHILPTELLMAKIQTTDIGDYLCMARNREGSVTAVSKVIVAGPAVITVPPRNITKLEGDKAEFICEAKALPSNVSHRWFHNGVEISQLSWLETRTLVRRDGTLFINPTSSEDSGRYTCEVTNGIGNPESASAYLSVEYPARVTYSPTIQYLPLGLSGVVRCYVQANPPFQFITWTKDRRPFDPNSTPGVVTLNNGSLLFQRVSQEHQGMYRCTPYNIHGTAGTSSVMEVLVREPPMFTVKPKDTYQGAINSEVKMPCDGVGQPKPTITWRRADLEKLPKDRSLLRGGNLTIKGLKKEDHGRYECVLENEIATLVTSTLLLVESTTPHAPTNVSVNTSAFAATVTWLPAYDGGYEQSYVVWYRLADQGDSDWRTIKVIPDAATTITLYNLQPESVYDFQVLSKNVLGDGMFSVIVKAKTKTWDFPTDAPIYPTDVHGSTYIPTVQKPSGPKPWPPRNVTVIKEKEGIKVSWAPPLNMSVPVAFYFVEYRTSDKSWQRIGPINVVTEQTLKKLPGGKYQFRVFSYSILSVGSESNEVPFEIPVTNHEQNKSKAITAGVVGGILFFIAAIVLSVCAVKICNKRKRRKAEKAYMMVTCPVPDTRNGGHSHGGSPVPLKKFQEGGIPGIVFPRQVQRVVRRVVRLLRSSSSSSAARSTAAVDRQRPSRSRNADGSSSSEWPTRSSPSALVGCSGPSPPRSRRFPKAVRYSVEMEYSRPLGWISRAPDGKFVVRGGGGGPARESAGFSGEQRRLATAEFPRDAHHLIPSSQASAAGVRSSLRSEGSGQSARQILYAYPHPLTLGRILPAPPANGRWASPAHLASQVSFSPASAGQAAIPTVYSPRDPRIRTSSPGLLSTVSPFVIEDLSSVNMPSSVERSFPSTVSSPFVRSLSPARLTPSSRELSSSRAYQDSRFRHQFRPIQRINADARPLRLVGVAVGPPVAGPQTPRRPAAAIARDPEPSSRVYLHRPHSRVGGTGSGDARVWRDGRRIHLPGHVPLPPNYGPPSSRLSPDPRIAEESGDDSHRHLEVPRVSAIQKAAMTPRQRAVYQRLQRQEPTLTGWYERPLATSSPPRTDRRVARVPPSPVKSAESRASADAKPNRTSAIDSTRPKTVREDGGGSESSGSDHRPITYTRDRLIGVVERVRSSGLHNHQGRNGQPFRNSAPELATAAREPTQSSPSPVTPSPRASPFNCGTDGSPRHSSGSSPSRRRGTVNSRSRSPSRARASSGLMEPDSTYASDDALRGLDRRTSNAPFSGPRSRTSVTSASSGRGSSGRASKLSHSRGDSLQGELEFTNRSSSSSGFASRTTALGGNSDPQSPRLVDSVRDIRVAEEFSFGVQTPALNDSRPPVFLKAGNKPETLPFSPSGSVASRLPRSPLDLSVDENYEFDSVSPHLECQILDKYSEIEPGSARHFHLPFNNESHVVRSSGDRGLSDSELYARVTSYPRPKRPSKYSNTEARCAALKEEFSRYRRRQLDLEDGSDELESAC